MTGTSTEFTQLPTVTTSGDKISDETLGSTGIKIQRMKIVLGDYSVDGGNVAADNPIPVVDSAAESNLATIVTEATAAATALGTQADASTVNSVIGLLKATVAAIGGNLKRNWTLAAGTDSVTATVNTISGFALETGGNLTNIYTKLSGTLSVNTISGFALEAGGNLAAILSKLNSGLGVTGTFWPTTAAAPSSAEISYGGAFIDPRAIRTLTSADTVTVQSQTNGYAQESNGNLAAINAATGTQADTAWSSGNGTIVALLKAAVTAIKGTLNVGVSAWTVSGSTLLGNTRDGAVSPTAISATLSTSAGAMFSAQTTGVNYWITNTSTSGQIIYISNTGAATANSQPILPGQTWTNPDRITSAPSFIASAASATYYGEWS